MLGNVAVSIVIGSDGPTADLGYDVLFKPLTPED